IMLQKEIKPVSKTSKSSSSDLEIEIAELLYEKKKMEDNDNSSTLVPNNSTKELSRIQIEQHADVDYHVCPSLEAPKEDIGEDRMNSSAGFGDASADGRSVSPTKESPSCSMLDAEKPYSSSNRVMSAFPEANTQRVGKFETDLMAPPPMGLSPEVDDLSMGDFISET
ncbi:hypothetical protein D0Y65_046008, partial [Glycine soja]